MRLLEDLESHNLLRKALLLILLADWTCSMSFNIIFTLPNALIGFSIFTSKPHLLHRIPRLLVRCAATGIAALRRAVALGAMRCLCCGKSAGRVFVWTAYPQQRIVEDRHSETLLLLQVARDRRGPLALSHLCGHFAVTCGDGVRFQTAPSSLVCRELDS